MRVETLSAVAAVALVLSWPGVALAFGSNTWTDSGCTIDGQSAGHSGSYADAVMYMTSGGCAGKIAKVRRRAANGSVTGWASSGDDQNDSAYIQRSFSENDWVGADHRACATCPIRST